MGMQDHGKNFKILQEIAEHFFGHIFYRFERTPENVTVK